MVTQGKRKRLAKATVSSDAENSRETQRPSNELCGWDVYNAGAEPPVIDDAVAEDPEAARVERELWVYLPFTDQELTDTTLTSEEVVRMVERGYPALATSAMADFYQSARDHLPKSPPLTISVREEYPTTWPTTNTAMDSYWGQATDAEKALHPPDHQVDSTDDFAWLDMSERFSVKPCGSPDDSLMPKCEGDDSQEQHNSQEEGDSQKDRRKRPRKQGRVRSHQPLNVQTAAQKTTSVEQDECDVSYTKDDDFKDDTDPQTVADERRAWSPIYVPFSGDALLDITLTSDDVVRMFETAYPILSTSNHRIRTFWDSVNQHLQSSPAFRIPVREVDPHTWPLTDPVVDGLWGDVTAAEEAGPWGDSSMSLLRQLPADVREFWDSAAHVFIRLSNSKVALIVGNVAIRSYTLYLKLMAIPHTTFWVFGKKRYASEIPLAWLEASANGRVINRISFAINHPEAFNRNRGSVVTDIQRQYAFRERIIDFCQAKMFGRIHLPGFLSTTSYVFQLSTGSILPVKALFERSKGNDTIKEHFSRPTLDTSSLDKTMERIAGLSVEQQLAIKAIRKSVNVKLADALSYWNRADIKLEYAGYIVTYILLTTTWRNRKASTVSRTRATADQQPPEIQEEERLRHNARQVARRNAKSGIDYIAKAPHTREKLNRL
ncbi:hypothetical protein J4E93_000032 [Alternaria ventricosa]|uniref:uncharacterized protein n=1 Tax=Alternaria ventricosa TaxID=1187951 RepID=UPI0020C3A9E5|nr:uncharacterized protein J4E93_000032 [Alternaria ventricosa]KAI4655321.1 hypothetical protein J4E93_000032 [Alternaria ventricosa]